MALDMEAQLGANTGADDEGDLGDADVRGDGDDVRGGGEQQVIRVQRVSSGWANQLLVGEMRFPLNGASVHG